MRFIAASLTATAIAVGATLIAGCSTGPEDVGESESADTKADQCTWLDIASTCKLDTTWVKNVDVDLQPLNTAPGSATPAPSTCSTFNCSNFAGNFCRCAEKLCPGKVGKMIFQSSVMCTKYQDCTVVNVKHALDIFCEPSQKDASKKTCKCVEPQPGKVSGRPWVYKGSERDIGIDETPDANFCQAPVCDAFIGPGWKACEGNGTSNTCNNVNQKDACPATCCIKPDGSTPEYCNECKAGTIKLCGADTRLSDSSWCTDPKTKNTVKKPAQICNSQVNGTGHKWNGWDCDTQNRQWFCPGSTPIPFDDAGVYVAPVEPIDFNDFG